MNFHLLYSIVLTICLVWIEFSHFPISSNSSSTKIVKQEIIAIPPKPEGVVKESEIQGEGKGVFYTEEGCYEI